MADKPVFFLAQRSAVKCSLTLTAPLELKRPIFPPSAFCIVANLQQNISLPSFNHLLHMQPVSCKTQNFWRRQKLIPFYLKSGVLSDWMSFARARFAINFLALQPCRAFQPADSCGTRRSRERERQRAPPLFRELFFSMQTGGLLLRGLSVACWGRTQSHLFS